MEGLWSELKGWQDTFTKGLEQFGGEVLHERQQEIKQLRTLVNTQMAVLAAPKFMDITSCDHIM